MGCYPRGVICERFSKKPFLCNTFIGIIVFVSIIAGYFFLVGLGWFVRIIISASTDDWSWNCWIWIPFWWCFWNGVLYAIGLVFIATALFLIGAGIYFLVVCLCSIGKEIGEISEETRLIKDDLLTLKTNA